MKVLWHLLFTCLLFSKPLFAQRQINVNMAKVDFKPSFTINGVKDARLDKENIGIIMSSSTQTESLQLQGGLEFNLKRAFTQTIPQTDLPLHLMIKILELRFTETKLPNSNISGHVSIQLAFDRIGKKDTVQLTETTTSTSYIRSNYLMDNKQYEGILNKLLTKSLEYFDKWLLVNGTKHEALVKGIKMIFLPETDVNDSDTIYYHTRKITWDDFRGKPSNSRYGAAIFANFAYTASFEVIDGYIVAKIATKTYMVRGMSWVIPPSLNDYALAHEQLHFDIAKLVAERFKKKVSTMQADLIIDLNSMIQYEYLESYREMNRLQKQYDTETNHSIIRSAQMLWEQKIQAWLKEIEN